MGVYARAYPCGQRAEESRGARCRWRFLLITCTTPLDAIVGSRIKSGAAQRRGTPTHLAGSSFAAKRTRRTRANINYESKALINADNVVPRANHFGHRGPPCRAPRGPAVHRTACVGEGQGRPRVGGGRRSAVGARVPPHAGGHRGQSAPSTPVKVLGRARERPTAPREGAKGPPLRCTTNFGRFSPDKRTPPAGANCTLRRRLAVSSRRAVCSSAASGLRRVGPPLPNGC